MIRELNLRKFFAEAIEFRMALIALMYRRVSYPRQLRRAINCTAAAAAAAAHRSEKLDSQGLELHRLLQQPSSGSLLGIIRVPRASLRARMLEEPARHSINEYGTRRPSYTTVVERTHADIQQRSAVE